MLHNIGPLFGPRLCTAGSAQRGKWPASHPMPAVAWRDLARSPRVATARWRDRRRRFSGRNRVRSSPQGRGRRGDGAEHGRGGRSSPEEGVGVHDEAAMATSVATFLAALMSFGGRRWWRPAPTTPGSR
jgi:hypothetical protein